MFKKQGNITWFGAVFLVNPWARSAIPHVASTSVPKAGSSWEDSTSQAASASSPQTVSFQAVSSPQPGSSQQDSASQAASTSSPQTVNAQAVSSNSS